MVQQFIESLDPRPTFIMNDVLIMYVLINVDYITVKLNGVCLCVNKAIW